MQNVHKYIERENGKESLHCLQEWEHLEKSKAIIRISKGSA